MGKRFPSGAGRTIVFAHGPPGPFAQIGAPAFPMLFAAGILFKTLFFGGEGRAFFERVVGVKPSQSLERKQDISRSAGSKQTRQQPSRGFQVESSEPRRELLRRVWIAEIYRRTIERGPYDRNCDRRAVPARQRAYRRR